MSIIKKAIKDCDFKINEYNKKSKSLIKNKKAELIKM